MLLECLLSHVNHRMVGVEESSYSNRDPWATAHLMEVVRWDEKAVSFCHMRCLGTSIPEERPFVVVRSDKFHGRVVVWQPVPASVYPFPIVLRHYGEVLVAHVDAHHVLHRVCVRLCQRAVPLPESHDADLEQLVHQLWQLQVVLEFAWRVLERVVIVVFSVRLSELFQEVLVSHVDAFGAVGEIGESVVALSLCVDDLIACLLDQVGLVPPAFIRYLQLSIPLEEAWPVLLHVVVEEPLGCHCSVVALWHLVIMWHAQLILSFGKVLMQIFVTKLLSHHVAQSGALGRQLLVKASAGEQDDQEEEVDFEREQNG